MSKTTTRILLLAGLAAAVGAFFWFDLGQYFSLAELRDRRDELLTYIDRTFPVALLIFIGAYIVMAALSLPGAAILTLAGGALFGLVAGTLAVSLASTVGATLVFLAARFLFRDTVQKRFGKRLKRINEGVERDGAFYLLALRLVPIFPFWVINLVMALTPIRTWTYAWVSLVGMFPATVVYVNAGGRFDWSLDTCRAVNRRLRRPLGDLAPAFVSNPAGPVINGAIGGWTPRG